MRRQSIAAVLGEAERIAGKRVSGVERSAPDDAVVAVGEIRRPGALGIVGEERLGLPATDAGDDLAAQDAGVLDLAVGMPQKGDLGQTQAGGGRAGFRFAQRRHRGGIGVRVGAPLVAGGDEQEPDVGAGGDGPGQRAGAPALDVVGVRRHGHNAVVPGRAEDAHAPGVSAIVRRGFGHVAAPLPARPRCVASRSADAPGLPPPRRGPDVGE